MMQKPVYATHASIIRATQSIRVRWGPEYFHHYREGDEEAGVAGWWNSDRS